MFGRGTKTRRLFDILRGQREHLAGDVVTIPGEVSVPFVVSQRADFQNYAF